MSSIFDLVQQQLQGDGLRRISEQLGTSQGETQSAIAAALPMVMGGMAQHASQPGGADLIHQAVDAHAGGDAGLLHGGAGGGGLIGRMLGNRHEQVQQGVSKASTLSPEKTGKLLLLLAPIVLAALAHKRKQDGTTPQQLPEVLQQGQAQAQQHAEAEHPHLGGGLLGGLLGQIMGKL
ncbi:MAG: DUF937 domain-containing protein [Gemmatimonadota bacterium]